jgi:hypothetical protein
MFKPAQTYHDEKCEFEEVIYAATSSAVRKAFCRTHQRWAYEWPVKRTVTFADGSYKEYQL